MSYILEQDGTSKLLDANYIILPQENSLYALVKNGNEVNPHSHPENEQVALLLEGECDYYVDGVPYRLTPGSWVTVPKGVEHYIHVYDSPVPCMQMDIFYPIRPEYIKSFSKFVEENTK